MIPTSSQVFFQPWDTHMHSWETEECQVFYTILDEINLLINEIGEKVYSDLG